ncbi:unnamed protein product [Hermetia illucens]|uniref:Secernin-2 n=1 Tax=Hermetia illucens TaxID=343691 RepID=A0A7R8V738_HERIL|nr:secernin-2 [Hermetia illucens]CAD7093222.1 unnamed protein product [Hermetia illucens]
MANSNSGDCFVLKNGRSVRSAIIFGRNSLAPEGEVHEVVYFPGTSGSTSVTCDGGASIDCGDRFGVILSRPVGLWGGESGGNEKDVVVGLSWSEDEPSEGGLKATDIVRLALERSPTAEDAINEITSLTNSYTSESTRFSFVLCDRHQVWFLSIAGKHWAAELMSSDFQRIPSTCLNVRTEITKSSDNLKDNLKDAGIWNGTDDFNFAKLFCSNYEEPNWPDPQPEDGPQFGTRDMMAKLREADADNVVRSSHVSHIDKESIAAHWFTATPFPQQSVFKPFVFAPNPKISPLTQIVEGETLTLLQKLHGQRNWEKVGDLLKSLEETCYEELNSFLIKHPEANSELDELMKDCVEAEVKFYR